MLTDVKGRFVACHLYDGDSRAALLPATAALPAA